MQCCSLPHAHTKLAFLFDVSWSVVIIGLGLDYKAILSKGRSYELLVAALVLQAC